MTDTSAPQIDVPDEMSEVDQMLAALGDIAHPAGEHLGEHDEPLGEGGDDAPSEESPNPEEEPAADEGVESTSPSSLVPPGYIDFEGQHLPVADVRAFLELNERLRSDPQVAERVTKALAPPQESPALPEWIDPEDQTTVRMWNHLQEVEQKSSALQAQARAVAEREQRARVVDGFRAGVSSFRARYPHLSDDQIAAVAQATGRANIVDGLERTEGSISAAFDKGMEMVLWGDPKLRSLAQAEGATTVSAKSNRKAKQSALSGSGGSAPQTKRSTEKPKTREELMAQMLDSVRNDPDLQ